MTATGASGPAYGQPAKAPAPPAAEPGPAQKDPTAKIITQPARDIGVSKPEIPPVLVEAAADPYSLKGLRSCRQLAEAVKRLNVELGPDFQPGGGYDEDRSKKLAEAGGRTIVNAIIPFRSLVREVSGAAKADRRMEAAVDAGLARRGFLRGVHRRQGCRTTF